MAEIVTLYKDSLKTEEIYPRTVVNAITTNEGETLGDVMSELNEKMDSLIDLLQGGALEDFVILSTANHYDANTATCSYTANEKKIVLAMCASTWGANSGASNKFNSTMTISTTGTVLNSINNGILNAASMQKYPLFRIEAILLENGQTVNCSCVSSTTSYVTNVVLILGKA